MRNYRTLSDFAEGYLRDHPEEVDDYITVLFDEYAQSGDAAALFSSLRIVSRVKGVSRIAEAAGMSRKGLQKALSEDGNPEFARVNAIMRAMGSIALRHKKSIRQGAEALRPEKLKT